MRNYLVQKMLHLVNLPFNWEFSVFFGPSVCAVCDEYSLELSDDMVIVGRNVAEAFFCFKLREIGAGITNLWSSNVLRFLSTISFPTFCKGSVS